MIRLANENDINIIANNYLLFDKYWSKQTFLESSKNSMVIVITAQSNLNASDNYSSIFGFAIISDKLDNYDLDNICIRYDLRHLGYGSKLLQYIVKNYSNKDIILEVDETNSIAISLYSKYGFKQISSRKNYYSSNTAIIMKKEKVNLA